tara:strand:- start:167 stop:1024 length:858 start_codon:yes stop_codon:yes gene_type:complete
MVKKLKYFFEAIFIYISFLISKILGLYLSRIIFSNIFKLLGPLVRSNKIINNNLKKLPKEVPFDKKKIIVSNMWSNYGMTFVEYMFLKKFRNGNSHIKIDNEKDLDQILTNNKQVIFVSGHFANFEVMSMEITKKKINLATIYRPLNNFFLNFFMEYLRKKYICPNQIKKGRAGVKDTIDFINNDHSIALMIDQRVSEGEKIPLLGESAFTSTLPAQLATKFKMDIVPITLKRNKDNSFKMRLLTPIKPQNFKSKIEITKKLNQVLEKMIIENPDQWIWTHNRWK